MSHPFRRFAYSLAEALSMTVSELYSKVSSHEMTEWMAYNLTKDEKWVKQYERDMDREASKELSDEERLLAFKRLLGGNSGNSK